MIDIKGKLFVILFFKKIDINSIVRLNIYRKEMEMDDLNKTNKYDRKIPYKVKLGFGIANLGDTIITEFVGAFLLFFFTNIVGIRPALAGAIVFAGVLSDAVSDPVIGTLSDRSSMKSGQRRPFLLMSILPIITFTTLLFTPLNVSDNMKVVIYILVVICYWTSYTMFNIPYLSLGSELTTNNDEQVKLSGVRQVCGSLGLLFANALPMIVVAKFKDFGFTETHSWTATAFVLAVMSGLAILTAWRSTRGWEIPYEPSKEKQSFIKNIGKMLKFKPYILVIVAAFLFYIAFYFVNSTVIYNMISVIGGVEADTSVVYLAGTIVGMILTVVFGKLAIVLDKKNVFIGSMVIAGVSLIAFKFIGFNSILAQTVQFCLAQFAIIAFLMLGYNLIYDTSEVYEFKTGVRQTGLMVSYFSFFLKLGKALGLQLVGIILDISGYNANVTAQSAEAKNAIINMSSVIPGVLVLLCALAIVIYPITRDRFKAMQKARELRDAGKEYSTKEFEEML